MIKSSYKWLVIVNSPIMNNQFVVCKKEAITLYLPWCLNNIFHILLTEFWKIIDKFPWVVGVWYNEAKFELVWSNDFAAEIMSLNHLKLVDWNFSNAKVKGKTNGSKSQEIWTEMIFDDSSTWIILIANIIVNILSWDFDQCDFWKHIADLEPSKLEFRCVVC